MASNDEVKQFGKGLRKDMFLDEQSSDCSIEVLGSHFARFPCHKNILASVSSCFTDILEAQPDRYNGIIRINDIDPDVVYLVIKFVYFGYIHLKYWKTTTDLLKAASKFKILSLIHQCEEFLSKRVTLQNMCYVLEAAIVSDSERLAKEVEFHCSQVAFVILNTDVFQKLDLVTVHRIISNSNLQIRNEMQVFQAAWNWAIYRCCKNRTLPSHVHIVNEMSPLLECIGFQFMSKEELESIPQVALRKFYELYPDMKPCDVEEKPLNEDLCHEQGDEEDAFCNDVDLGNLVSFPPKQHKQGLYDLFPNLKCSPKRNSVNINPCHDQIREGGKECKSKQFNEGRTLLFPLLQFKFNKAFVFDCDFNSKFCLRGNIILMRFSVDNPVYLLTIEVKHRSDPLSSRKCISSLEVFNRNGTLTSLFRERSVNLHESSASKFNLHSFDAMELLFLKANVEYTIKISCDLYYSNLVWPLTTVKNKMIGDVEINIFTQKCFGITSIIFIEA